MMCRINALPIGFSDIERVIRTGYYVDKTRYAQELLEKETPVFIARPRRFGKSLFIDTLETISSGRQELFEDYHIGRSENKYQWKKYPIIRLDFSRLTNDTTKELKASIKMLLKEVASSYNIKIKAATVDGALSSLVDQLVKLGDTVQNKEKVESVYEPRIVVLIDEYDGAILHSTEGSDIEKGNIKVMKDFFMTLKSLNDHVKFSFITGVSKFSLSDIFSGSNNLDDLTPDITADAMFGFTQEEILSVFSKKLDDIAAKWSQKKNKEVTASEVMQRIAVYYNGYKFHPDGMSVYNPWSMLKFLKSGEVRNYWYQTGNPSLIINQMLIDPDRLDIITDDPRIQATEEDIMYTGSRNEIGLKSLMFQTGYLTIESYNKFTRQYTLRFPNKEIQEPLQRSLKSVLKKV